MDHGIGPVVSLRRGQTVLRISIRHHLPFNLDLFASDSNPQPEKSKISSQRDALIFGRYNLLNITDKKEGLLEKNLRNFITFTKFGFLPSWVIEEKMGRIC